MPVLARATTFSLIGVEALEVTVEADIHPGLPAFAIVEQGATVDPRAHVHDAVVLRGAVVEAGGVAVRSLICPGGSDAKTPQGSS